MIRTPRRLSIMLVLALSISLVFARSAWAESAEKPTFSDDQAQTPKHDVIIRYKNVPKHDKITFQHLTDDKLIQDAVSILQDVLAVYPQDIGNLLRMPYINLVDGLDAKNSVHLNGIALSKYEANDLVINRVYLRYPTKGEPRAIYHHEIFHAIEAAYPVNEKTWASFSPETQYGISSKDYQKAPDHRSYIARKNGYFSTYSYLSASEDRAEVFAYLMHPQIPDIYTKAMFANDDLLQKKAAFIVGYIQAVFADHQDSERLIHQISRQYDNLYAQPYFAARSIHQVRTNATVYMHYDASGQPLSLYANDYLYILEELNNPANTYLALDKNANLVYVPKRFTKKVEDMQILPLIEALKKQDIRITYASHDQRITGTSILKDRKIISQRDSRLLYVTLTLLKNKQAADPNFPASRIVFLRNMQENKKPVSAVLLDNTLYIDIHHASEQAVLNALKTA